MDQQKEIKCMGAGHRSYNSLFFCQGISTVGYLLQSEAVTEKNRNEKMTNMTSYY